MIYICRAVYYKIFSIPSFLNVIFWYFSRMIRVPYLSVSANGSRLTMPSVSWLNCKRKSNMPRLRKARKSFTPFFSVKNRFQQLIVKWCFPKMSSTICQNNIPLRCSLLFHGSSPCPWGCRSPLDWSHRDRVRWSYGHALRIPAQRRTWDWHRVHSRYN